MDALKEIAEKKIRQEGYDYPVTVSLGTTYFPVKEYGDMAFPAGDYEALRVQIGKSKGRNWWCVVYPSLCLVDGVYQTVPENSKDKLKQVLSTSEYRVLGRWRRGCTIPPAVFRLAVLNGLDFSSGLKELYVVSV